MIRYETVVQDQPYESFFFEKSYGKPAMFESLVASVLSRVLGDYVSNLNPSQLKISIWSGEVVLNNLKLKTSALDKFHLPINVKEGYLGHLTMFIPWNDLKNKPIKIRIKNVYLLAAPIANQEYDYQEELDRELQIKFSKLETAELLSKERGDINDKDATFMAQLATKIVDNLQISIEEIHIRYEDNVSVPDQSFSVGFTLNELSAISTSADWKEALTNEESSDIIHKLVKLGSLAVYWNTHDAQSLGGLEPNEAIKRFMQLIDSSGKPVDSLQYILKPVSGTGKLILRKHYEKGIAQNSAELDFEVLGFELDDEQYNTGISLWHSFEMYMRSSKYKKYRPPNSIKPKMDPMAWFKFAGKCVLEDIHAKNVRWTWEQMKERRDDRKAYIKLRKLSKATPNVPLSIGDSALFFQLERKLAYEDLQLYRSIAKNELKKEKIIAGRAEQALSGPAKAVNTWSSYFWGETKNDAAIDNQTIMSDADMKDLMETIEFDPEAALLNTNLPKEAILLDLNCHLGTGSFCLKSKPHSKNPVNLIAMMSSNFEAKVIRHPGSAIHATISLQSMECKDGTTEGTLYPSIIRAKSEFESEKDKFFTLVYEMEPLDELADSRLILRMLPLEVVYNPSCIKSIIGFFTVPDDLFRSFGDGQMSALKSVAMNTFNGITAQTRLGLEYAIEEHKTLDMQVDIDAPIFIFPEEQVELDINLLVVLMLKPA